MKKKHFLSFLLFFLTYFYSFSQISFCPGSTGEAIFEEDFGQGVTNGPPLDASITSYNFVNQAPNDGEYTISSNLMQLGSFHNIPDHTGNTNGKALIVNASFDAGLFFQIPIDGLCENNPYEFSAFLINLYDSSNTVCANGGIPVNVRFQIWDETDTNLLAEGSTGDIPGTPNPFWDQYAVNFETLPGQTSVILKMLNNGNGGCGNDLAIDDIAFKSCGDLTEIFNSDMENNFSICENESTGNLTLTANPDFSVYNTHFYQWQQSDDNINWNDIPGETSESLELNNVSQTQYYRVLVAEDLINVENSLCNSISEVFRVEEVNFITPSSLGDVETCEGEDATLEVQNNSLIRVDWYDAAVGGNLLLENSYTFEPETSGTYYAEGTTINGDCVSPNRTAVSLDLRPIPENEPVSFEICPGEEITLDATLANVSYLWSTGDSSAQINVSEAGTYSVERSVNSGCSSTKVFEVTISEAPIVQNIRSENNDIVIDLANEGDFLFSLDGQNFQSSPIFDGVPGGLYTIIVDSSSNCEAQAFEFIHLVIPNFFTPNEDGINDVFKIPADRFFDNFKIYIFDRFGKLIIASERAPFVWDGTYNGKPLPSQDFWYRVIIDGKTISGHVTVKR